MIIAVDPGKMTGLAFWEAGEFDSFQLPTWEAVMRVDDALGPNVEAVVCESYHITMQTLKKTREENWSMESIGALRYISFLNDVPFVLQSPADRMFGSDEKLKNKGWWNPTTGGHANDAARHIMLYLARTDRLSEVLP